MFIPDPARAGLGHELGDHAALDDEGEVAGARVAVRSVEAAGFGKADGHGLALGEERWHGNAGGDDEAAGAAGEGHGWVGGWADAVEGEAESERRARRVMALGLLRRADRRLVSMSGMVVLKGRGWGRGDSASPPVRIVWVGAPRERVASRAMIGKKLRVFIFGVYVRTDRFWDWFGSRRFRLKDWRRKKNIRWRTA